MIEAAFDRIATAIARGRGSRLIAVIVPPTLPMLPAAQKLQSHLLGRGVDLRPVNVEGTADLLEAVATSDQAAGALLVHGLEALADEQREAFLRQTSFTRARLRAISTPIVLVLGTETWSWLGMELPDLARWADGPFLLTPTGKAPALRPLRPELGRGVVAPSRVLLDEFRNVDLHGPVDRWMRRGGILMVGGPLATGGTSFVARIERRLASMGTRTRATGLPVILDGGAPMVGNGPHTGDPDVPPPRDFSASRFEDWLDQEDADVVIIRRSFARVAPGALRKRGMTGLVLGSTRDAMTRTPGVEPLYFPPVQVAQPDGTPHPVGVDAMARAVRADAAEQLEVDLDERLCPDSLTILAHASGGRPGILWELLAEVDRRSRRLGGGAADAKMVNGVIRDAARWLTRSAPSERVARATRENLLDFELEAKSLVLFYVIEGELRTLENPLLTVAREAPGPTG